MYKGGNAKRQHKKHNSLNIFIIIFLILIMTALVFLIIHKKQSRNKTLSICSNTKNQSILSEASQYLSPIQSKKLSDVAQRIVKLDKYNQDPNCDYILLGYYLGYNYPNAQYYYDQLNKYYSAQNGYSPIIAKQVMSFAELQSKLNNAKSTDNEIKNKTFYVRGSSR